MANELRRIAILATGFDGLILPGGTCNPDRLRMDEDAVAFVRAFVESGKPVAAICGPWTLLEAGVLKGRKITSFPSLRTDLRNAGADVVDDEAVVDEAVVDEVVVDEVVVDEVVVDEVVVDENIISSRNPDDLPAFCDTVVREFSAVHA